MGARAVAYEQHIVRTCPAQNSPTVNATPTVGPNRSGDLPHKQPGSSRTKPPLCIFWCTRRPDTASRRSALWRPVGSSIVEGPGFASASLTDAGSSTAVATQSVAALRTWATDCRTTVKASLCEKPGLRYKDTTEGMQQADRSVSATQPIQNIVTAICHLW